MMHPLLAAVVAMLLAACRTTLLLVETVRNLCGTSLMLLLSSFNFVTYMLVLLFLQSRQTPVLLLLMPSLYHGRRVL